MPMQSDGTFARIWKFVDQYIAGDNALRTAFDASFDDLTVGVNAALDRKAIHAQWDASSGAFPSGSFPFQSYIVTVAGTVDGVPFAVNDVVIALVRNASTTTFSANWRFLERAGGPVVFATKAAANAALDGLANGDVVDVEEDESRLDYHTRYRVVSGALAFQKLLEPVRVYANSTEFLLSEEASRGLGELTETKDGGVFSEVAPSDTDNDVANLAGVKFDITRARNYVDVRWFGAKCDGIADDAAAIRKAILHMNRLAISGTLYIPGTPLLASAVDFYGNFHVKMDGANVDSYFLVNDHSLLEPVTFGLTKIFGGRVEGMNVTRPSYSGATENIGVAFYDVAGATFVDFDSRYSKYPARFKPGDGQRVAYNTFVNFRATGGFRNISTDRSGTGFFNENVFLGGRCITSADTETQIYIDDNVNHNRFVMMSIEGAGDQAVYLSGEATNGSFSNVFDQCRTEGTWVNDDYVITANAMRNEIRAWNVYATVTDGGLDNYIQTIQQGVSWSTGYTNAVPLSISRTAAVTDDSPVLNIVEEFTSSGNSNGIKVTANRVSGYLLKLLYSTTELFKVTLISATQSLVTNVGRVIFTRNQSDRSEPILRVHDEFTSSGDINGIEVLAGRFSGSVIKSVQESTSTEQGRIGVVSNSWQFHARAADWQTPPLRFADYYLWVDTSGRLRIKDGEPTSTTDGTVVGTQS